MAITLSPDPPLFFCCPGDRRYSPDNVKKTFSDHDKPSPWRPLGTRLRVKVLSQQEYHQVFLDIIKASSLAWMDHLYPMLSLEWVSDKEDADIRISFSKDVPCWSAIGSRATQYGKGEPTMNFNFTDWAIRADGPVHPHTYSHAHIARMAAHLFGHALGIPHAHITWSSQWLLPELEKQCGQFFAGVARAEYGDPQLRNPDSIMLFDHPAVLCQTTVDQARQGGLAIDEEARTYLRNLYPPAPEVMCLHDITSSSGHQLIKTMRTESAVGGITHIDMAHDQVFRLDCNVTNVQKGTSFDVWPHTWLQTKLIEARQDVLAFDVDDHRAQAGWVSYIDTLRSFMAGADKDTTITQESPDSKKRTDLAHTEQGVFGMTIHKHIKFWRRFDRRPQVVCFITVVDVENVANVRIKASADSISEDGFTLSIGSWEDTRVYNLAAYWLAHDDSENSSIRSSTCLTPYHKDTTVKEDSLWMPFSNRLGRPPRYVFRGLNYIDCTSRANLRLKFELQRGDDTGAEALFSTWEDESRYYQLGGSIVAIL